MPDFCDFSEVIQLPCGMYRHLAKCGLARDVASDAQYNKVCNKSCDPSYIRPAPIVDGVGKELKQMFADMGQHDTGGCGCDGHVDQMNRWGVEGCKEHRAEIIGWLKASAAKLTKRERLAMYRKARKLGIPISLRKPYGSLLDEAIRRASPQQPPHEKPSKAAE